jgi:hypothetical protein
MLFLPEGGTLQDGEEKVPLSYPAPILGRIIALFEFVGAQA